jgi:hypothetical protein
VKMHGDSNIKSPSVAWPITGLDVSLCSRDDLHDAK